MLDVFIDALLDSLKVFGISFLIYLLLSFFEGKISKSLEKHRQISPLIGSAMGLVPQCGISVVAADLYLKDHITVGTLLAIFISCSDEAIPVMLSNISQASSIVPLLAIKFVVGFVVGFFADAIFKSSTLRVENEAKTCNHKETVHVGCCGHEIDNEKENNWHEHLLHPLYHSFKIFIYVLIVNLVFGIIFFYVGEDSISLFLQLNKYFQPLFSTLVGLIPNCASSVLISELYIKHSISFGACLAGLIVNAGLGMVVLFKNKQKLKQAFIILGILVGVALFMGYMVCLSSGF